MDRYLNILEEPQRKVEEKIDEEKLRFIASKITIWDFFGIQQSTYLGYSKPEKSRMFSDYYQRLVSEYFGVDKKKSAFFVLPDFVWHIFWCFVLVNFLVFYSAFFF